jgi:hypothetical protein
MGATNPIPEVARAARDAVRGLRNWDSLTSVGISVKVGESACEIDNPSKQVVSVEPKDVAEGFVRLSGDPVALRNWANVLLAASAFLDLRLETDAYGQILLEGIWDASNDGSVRQSALLAARELYSP